MPRIRTIKPEFPQSESMGNVSRDARLLFIELWTLCDDSGRTRAASRMLASLLFPYDDDAPKLIDGWLEELDREGCIIRYSIDGASYIEVCNWLNHQKIDRPSPSKIPPPTESSRILANPREPSSVDQGSRTKEVDQGKERAPRFDAARRLAELGVPESIANDWIAHRKAKKASITETVIDGIAREASKAGMALGDALATCCQRGWTGFKADWVADKGPVSSIDRQRQMVAISLGQAPATPTTKEVGNEFDGTFARIAG